MSLSRTYLAALGRLGKTRPIIVQRGFATAAPRPQELGKENARDRTTHFGFETIPESVKESKGAESRYFDDNFG